MTGLPKILICSLGGFLVMAVGVASVVMTAEYHPDGVKPHQREAYAKRMEEIERLQQLAASVQSDSKPVAVAESTKFNFGMVDPHSTLTHGFLIENHGDLPLELNVQGTSCKCTMGDLESDVLLPGESTTVTMTWNTGYKSEAYTQTAIIATNDPVRSIIELEVSGEVKAELIAPEQLAFDATDVGVQTEATFIVFSQVWDDFTITDVQCDAPGFEWVAEPIGVDVVALSDSDASSAWQIRAFTAPFEFGEFKSKLTVTAQPNDGGEDVTRELTCMGKVRKPINFYHPDIHPTHGLDVGTLIAGKEHQFHVVVRARTDVDRPIEVLKLEPKELQASLEPLGTAGSYRLTLTIPDDCPMLVFNADQKRGFVQIGDPDNKDFSNWFPLLGAVVPLDKK